MKPKAIFFFCIQCLLIVGCSHQGSINEQLLHELRRETPDIEKVKELIKIGGDKDGMPPLLMAAYKGHTKIVKYLVASGADLNVASENGYTPLHIASSEGHPEVVNLLVDSDADVNKANKDGSTPLHIAASEGHFEIVRMLINAGGDVTIRNNKGESCLTLARLSVNYQMVDSIIKWDPEADRDLIDLDIIGTTWNMVDSDGSKYILTFKSGGLFTYKKQSTSYGDRNETWKLEGNSIQISFNNGYKVKKGTIHRRWMEGSYISKSGWSGTWNATRK